jgi:hypothetical protein
VTLESTPSVQNANTLPLISATEDTEGVENGRTNTFPLEAIAGEPMLHSPVEGGLLLEGHFAGNMDMAADVDTVGRYLNSHRGWFTRCAHPMQVEPISDHGYALVVGHFSTLGYEVEPKVGLYLSPLDHRVYRIDTIPIPGYVPPGYDVDFQAVLRLQEAPEAVPSTALTQVDWNLSLAVNIHMPRLFNSVPRSLLKSSGDRLLNQVVRQVSKRLTRKVQEDFHHSHNLPLPQSYHGHHFWSNWGKRSGSESH